MNLSLITSIVLYSFFIIGFFDLNGLIIKSILTLFYTTFTSFLYLILLFLG